LTSIMADQPSVSRSARGLIGALPALPRSAPRGGLPARRGRTRDRRVRSAGGTRAHGSLASLATG
jgi:hypothetical protein